jgi:hypothetical protein
LAGYEGLLVIHREYFSPEPSGREVPGVEDPLALDVLKVRVEKRQDWHVLGQDLLHAGYHF